MTGRTFIGWILVLQAYSIFKSNILCSDQKTFIQDNKYIQADGSLGTFRYENYLRPDYLVTITQTQCVLEDQHLRYQDLLDIENYWKLKKILTHVKDQSCGPTQGVKAFQRIYKVQIASEREYFQAVLAFEEIKNDNKQVHIEVLPGNFEIPNDLQQCQNQSIIRQCAFESVVKEVHMNRQISQWYYTSGPFQNMESPHTPPNQVAKIYGIYIGLGNKRSINQLQSYTNQNMQFEPFQNTQANAPSAAYARRIYGIYIGVPIACILGLLFFIFIVWCYLRRHLNRNLVAASPANNAIIHGQRNVLLEEVPKEINEKCKVYKFEEVDSSTLEQGLQQVNKSAPNQNVVINIFKNIIPSNDPNSITNSQTNKRSTDQEQETANQISQQDSQHQNESQLQDQWQNNPLNADNLQQKSPQNTQPSDQSDLQGKNGPEQQGQEKQNQHQSLGKGANSENAPELYISNKNQQGTSRQDSIDFENSSQLNQQLYLSTSIGSFLTFKDVGQFDHQNQDQSNQSNGDSQFQIPQSQFLNDAGTQHDPQNQLAQQQLEKPNHTSRQSSIQQSYNHNQQSNNELTNNEQGLQDHSNVQSGALSQIEAQQGKKSGATQGEHSVELQSQQSSLENVQQNNSQLPAEGTSRNFIAQNVVNSCRQILNLDNKQGQSNKANDKAEMALKVCAICIEPPTKGDLVKQLPCSHIFHPECIDRWFMRGKSECPVCRDKLIS